MSTTTINNVTTKTPAVEKHRWRIEYELQDGMGRTPYSYESSDPETIEEAFVAAQIEYNEKTEPHSKWHKTWGFVTYIIADDDTLAPVPSWKYHRLTPRTEGSFR